MALVREKKVYMSGLAEPKEPKATKHIATSPLPFRDCGSSLSDVTAEDDSEEEEAAKAKAESPSGKEEKKDDDEAAAASGVHARVRFASVCLCA